MFLAQKNEFEYLLSSSLKLLKTINKVKKEFRGAEYLRVDSTSKYGVTISGAMYSYLRLLYLEYEHQSLVAVCVFPALVPGSRVS